MSKTTQRKRKSKIAQKPVESKPVITVELPDIEVATPVLPARKRRVNRRQAGYAGVATATFVIVYLVWLFFG